MLLVGAEVANRKQLHSIAPFLIIFEALLVPLNTHHPITPTQVIHRKPCQLPPPTPLPPPPPAPSPPPVLSLPPPPPTPPPTSSNKSKPSPWSSPRSATISPTSPNSSAYCLPHSEHQGLKRAGGRLPAEEVRGEQGAADGGVVTFRKRGEEEDGGRQEGD